MTRLEHLQGQLVRAVARLNAWHGRIEPIHIGQREKARRADQLAALGRTVTRIEKKLAHEIAIAETSSAAK